MKETLFNLVVLMFAVAVYAVDAVLYQGFWQSIA